MIIFEELQQCTLKYQNICAIIKSESLIEKCSKAIKNNEMFGWRDKIMGENKVIVIPDGKICDYIDGKFRNDTPEEYVRQTIEKRLVNEHKYSLDQISIEYTLQLG